MAVEFHDVQSLVSWIKTTAADIIFLDGECGSGKTWLASELTKTGFAKISVDDPEFLIKKTGRYVHAIKVNSLKARISEIQSSPIIIDCICARDVAEALSTDNARFVFVVRVTAMGLDEYSPGDEIEINPATSIDPNLMPIDGTAPKEVFGYRVRTKPRTHADAIFRNKPNI